MSTWSPERTISTALATRLVREQFPSVTGDLIPLGEGWDNTVFAAEDRWAFRFPRRQVALDGLAREISVLPAVARSLPLPVPEPVMHGAPGHDYPWPFIGGLLVAGEELSSAGLSDRVELGSQLGAFLRVLHTLQPPARLPADPMDRGFPAAREQKTRDATTVLRKAGLWDGDESALLSTSRELEASPIAVLVHGDLHLRHVLVDAAGHATGVIDWGDSCVADPSVDLSFGYAALAGPALDAFVSSYGKVDHERELRARALAFGLSAMLAVYAHAEGRSALLAESLTAMKRAALIA